MSKYQLLPELALDDFERLKASIVERGVKMPVVLDENGEILDGHNRVKIADSLGIEYPRMVESGLDEHEKRIFVAELNAARRQLTDAQKVALGKRIEPDIAARAEKRRLANLRRGDVQPEVDTCPPREKTRDEVARAVQLGSGRTYERGKQVLDELESQPDGPQLLKHVESGDWTLDDARQELRTRRKAELEKQAHQEQETSNRYMNTVGDPDGKIAKARLLNQFSSVRTTVYDRLLPLKVEAVAAALNEKESDFTLRFIHDCRSWLDDLEGEMRKGVRLIHRKDAS